MQLKVNEKEYTVEFGFEAMYDSEFMKELFDMTENMDTDDVKKEINLMARIPYIATNMLYIGLKEHHADEFESINDAKELIKAYLKESKENTMLVLYTQLMKTIEDDGFLEQMGLGEKKKQVKTPQDHKRKTTTASKK